MRDARTVRSVFAKIATLIGVLSCWWWPASPASSEEVRPDRFTIEAMLRLSDLGNVSFSPDGLTLAVETIGPYDRAAEYGLSYFAERERSSLSLIDRDSGDATPITVRGAAGVWAGPWSPNGSRLVVYTYRADMGVGIGVWDVRKRRYKALPGVPEVSFDGAAAWLSDETLIYTTVADGEKPFGLGGLRQGLERYPELWRRSWAGKEASFSVLDSGGTLIEIDEPVGALRLARMPSGKTETIARGAFRRLSTAPGGGAVVALESRDVVAPDPALPINTLSDYRLHRILLVRAGRERTPTIASDEKDVSLFDFVSWSPAGGAFLFYGRSVDQPWREAALFRYSLGDGALAELNTTGIALSVTGSTQGDTFAPIYWLGTSPLVMAMAAGPAATAPSPPRLWRLDTDQAPVPADLIEGPPVSQWLQAGDGLLAVAGGAIWRIDATGDADQIQLDEAPPIMGFATRDMASFKAPLIPVLALIEGRPGPGLVDVEAGVFRKVDGPINGTGVAAVSGDGADLVYKVADHRGKRFLRFEGRNIEPRQLAEVNSWLEDITFATSHPISYAMPSAAPEAPPLTGWYLTPPDHVPGRRYPVVVLVYGGASFSPMAPHPLFEPQTPFYLHPQVFAAQGYVVLMPSLPLDMEATPLDIPAQLNATANAAIDALIAAGVADPDRLAIMGQSYGGYTTAAILTQTGRFKAAIATAGVYNLSSIYGVFDPRQRTAADAHTGLYLAGVAEKRQAGMKVGPWLAPDRYMRNSPLFRAGRIETPLLFLHGDADYVSITQAEEMFTALYRQRKRARLVRFWGEEHILQSPANIRQAWREADRWLAEHLKR